MRLSKTFVDRVAIPNPKPDGKKTQVIYRDEVLQGFALRVTSSGAKSFVVEKRVNGKNRRVTLGRYGHKTAEQARKEAAVMLGQMTDGLDPIQQRQDSRLKGVTLLEAFEDYFLAKKSLSPKTVHDYRRAINVAFKDWQSIPITRITKTMVETRHRALGQTAPTRANNAMRVLQAILNYAIHTYEDTQKNPLMAVNPVSHLTRVDAWYPNNRREIFIKPKDIPKWYEAVQQLSQETTRDYFIFLLLTGLRRSEASYLKWESVDFEENTFTIPVTKNGQSHTLPLSDYLKDMLERRYEDHVGEYVFPGRAKGDCLREPRSAILRVCELSGVEFRLHDLRRTFITMADSLEISRYALMRLMNHKPGRDMTASYIIIDIEQLRAPMQKITDCFVKAFEGESVIITLDDYRSEIAQSQESSPLIRSTLGLPL